MAQPQVKKSITQASKFNDEGTAALDFKWGQRLFIETSLSIFKVQYKLIQGTGGFYEYEDTSTNRKLYLFITCNHVAHTNSIQDIIDFMEITNIQHVEDNKPPLTFKKEHLLFCWSRICYCLDATIIELSTEGERHFRALNVTFIKISDPLKDEPIAMLQVPDGKPKFALACITKIENSMVYYQMGTGGGASGAPLLNQSCMAVAIHRKASTIGAVADVPTTDQPDLTRVATALPDIIKAFINDRV